MFRRRVNSALLIDFDNVIGMTGGDFAAKIPHWMAWLEEGGFDPAHAQRRFLVKRVYWNGLNERYRPAFEAAGFEAFACRAIAKDKKSSADIVMTLDAMDVASDTRGLKEIVLLSSDTDFVPVVNRLQDRKLVVVAMGNEENATAAVYRDYADHVVLRSEFIAAFGYQRAPRGLFARRPQAPMQAPVLAPAQGVRAAPPPAPKPPQSAEPKASKKADALDDAAERVVRAAKGALGARLSRQSVQRALHGIASFTTAGPNAWLGFGAYQAFLRAIAKRRKELRLHSFSNGGVSVAYVSQEGA